MPGSKIPDWFSREVVRISERKNLMIKGVIICVVVSLDLLIQDDLRDQDPIIVGIEAILVKMNEPLDKIMLELKGVPKTHEDHLYLCRFPVHCPIVSKLKDGYEISIIEHDPPIIKGLKLKKYGIHLVYEDEDDYDGDLDEESLDESQLSISEKLSKFFSSLYEEENASQSDCEVESQVQEIEEEEERERSKPV